MEQLRALPAKGQEFTKSALPDSPHYLALQSLGIRQAGVELCAVLLGAAPIYQAPLAPARRLRTRLVMLPASSLRMAVAN